MQLDILPFRLPLAAPFRISHETRTEQPTIILRLHDADGFSGLGEAPMTRYYGLDTDKAVQYLEKVRTALEDAQNLAIEAKNLAPAHSARRARLGLPTRMGTGARANESVWTSSQNSYPPTLVLALHHFLDEQFPDISPFLRCALDVAAHDLWAKKLGRPLYQCWGSAQAERRIPTCYTIGFGPVEEMVAKVQAFPWPIYKIKLGTPDDLAIVEALRAVTTSPFRVDANTGWTQEQCLHIAPGLKRLGVEFIEQPLAVENWEGQKELFHKSPLPIIADESCQTLADIARCQGYFHGINIKIVKCGGLLEARKMIAAARAANLQIMAGCMTESSVGISAIAHLIPDLDYVDIDGALLLADEPALGVSFNAQGVVQFPPNCAGTGARLKKISV